MTTIKDAIENVKAELARRRRHLEELSKQNGTYHYDKSFDRDQYNFVHGEVAALRTALYCLGLGYKDVPNEVEK